MSMYVCVYIYIKLITLLLKEVQKTISTDLSIHS